MPRQLYTRKHLTLNKIKINTHCVTIEQKYAMSVSIVFHANVIWEGTVKIYSTLKNMKLITSQKHISYYSKRTCFSFGIRKWFIGEERSTVLKSLSKLNTVFLRPEKINKFMCN